MTLPTQNHHCVQPTIHCHRHYLTPYCAQPTAIEIHLPKNKALRVSKKCNPKGCFLHRSPLFLILSSAKPRCNSRKHKSSKENNPTLDPNIFVASDSKPSPTKLKSPLPLRPLSSDPLKRKLGTNALTDNLIPTEASDSGVRVVVRMTPLSEDKDRGYPIVQNISNDWLSINGQTFMLDLVADTEATQVILGDEIDQNQMEQLVKNVVEEGGPDAARAWIEFCNT